LKQLLTVVVGLFTILSVSIVIYLFKLRTLSIEGNNIYGIRCVETNVHLINYKSSFLNFADALKNPDDYKNGELMEFFNTYVSEMKLYVLDEVKWLDLQKGYISRWDFKLFEPWYIKEGFNIQWKIYEAYLDDAKTMLEVYDSQGAVNNLDDIKEIRKRISDFQDKYDELYDKVSIQNDWRRRFIYIPSPEACTEETEIIPNTSGSIEWEEKSATPSPTFVPANLNLSS